MRGMKEEDTMGISEILTQIDRELALLQQARALLVGSKGPGRKPKIAEVAKKPTKKRNLTPEGRKRIAEAVKRRWEKQKKVGA